jgi:hypothetical protein
MLSSSRVPGSPLLRYIELKTGYQEDGPAWIGEVSQSQSGVTIYFNGLALKRSKGGGIRGNYFDVESGQEYWVSGLKRDGSDRLHPGQYPIQVEARIVPEYLKLRGIESLEKSRYTVSHSIKKTDISKFVAIENGGLND